MHFRDGGGTAAEKRHAARPSIPPLITSHEGASCAKSSRLTCSAPGALGTPATIFLTRRGIRASQAAASADGCGCAPSEGAKANRPGRMSAVGGKAPFVGAVRGVPSGRQLTVWFRTVPSPKQTRGGNKGPNVCFRHVPTASSSTCSARGRESGALERCGSDTAAPAIAKLARCHSYGSVKAYHFSVQHRIAHDAFDE